MRQRGFSLIEVLFALLILTFVITTTLVMFVERQRRLQTANETILAYQVLANETEAQRRVAWNALADGTFATPTTLLRPLGPFRTSVRIERTSPYLKKVTMAIEWRDGARRAELAVMRADTGGTNLW